jgi:hypothetical protein
MQPEEAMPLATNMMGGGVVASRLAPAPAGSLGMNVWHGSPHRFPPTAKNPLGEFDPMKIGTGEGAQSYGVGAAYLAEAPEVAKGYQAKLTAQQKPNVVDTNLQKIYEKTGDWSKAVDEHMRRIYDTPKAKEKMRESLIRQGAPTNVEGGALYKVDLPDEQIAKMLDWDKPLSQQTSQEMKDAFNGIIKKYPELKEKFVQAYRDKQPGSIYYSILNDYRKSGDLAKNQLFASDALREAGIPGIRYLDQGSRNTSAGELIGVAKGADGWKAKIRKTPSGQVGDVIPMAPSITTSKSFPTEQSARDWANSQIGGGTSNFVVFNPAHMNIIGRE